MGVEYSSEIGYGFCLSEDIMRLIVQNLIATGELTQLDEEEVDLYDYEEALEIWLAQSHPKLAYRSLSEMDGMYFCFVSKKSFLSCGQYDTGLYHFDGSPNFKSLTKLGQELRLDYKPSWFLLRRAY